MFQKNSKRSSPLQNLFISDYNKGVNLFNNLESPSILVAVVFAWSIFWKGTALWRASKESQRNWFIALLLINTVGILDLAYLFYFSNKKLTVSELKSWLKFK